ncbi:hypothetical protein P5V67_12045 [Mycobacteroides abscessus subsp. abscessus]|uniref:hypothetical protein n=1 Tax=Mycobacteroides abscessus TaxID=36809 RepID=UPI00266DD483|nr:hypothetical protein [Mycobacteroides abscessus]MDO3245843.1 hypothetical protein [Mycobacteroides abscessus subsp. abscessus]MDO3346779.1 hypothetical protein [Mycobacteroides abscessus subsp. abscessus]
MADDDGEVPYPDAERELRLRLNAARLLVHSAEPNPDGVGLALADVSPQDAPEFWREVLELVAAYLPPEAVARLRDEILGLLVVLEDQG